MNKELYIVDDSSDHSFLLYRILKQITPVYPVRFFEDGKALHRQLTTLTQRGEHQNFPGLIILDLNMPVMNGLQLLKLLKRPSDNERSEWKHIPVVMMTSDPREEVMHQCYRAGANAFLIKPLEFDKLKNALQSTCKFWLEVNHLPEAT